MIAIARAASRWVAFVENLFNAACTCAFCAKRLDDSEKLIAMDIAMSEKGNFLALRMGASFNNGACGNVCRGTRATKAFNLVFT